MLENWGERNELLTKINSINRELEEQEITFKKVKEQGIYLLDEMA